MNLSTVTLTAGTDAVTLGQLLYPDGHATGFTLDNAAVSPAGRLVSRTDLPLVQGAAVTPGRLGARELSFSGTIVAATVADAQELAQDLIRVTRDRGIDPVIVTFDNGLDTVRVSGVLEGAVSIESAGGPFLTYSFTLLAGDPVSYSTTVTTVTAAGSATAANSGTATVFPTLTVSWSGGTTVDVAQSGGRRLRFVGLPSSGSMVVECQPGYESAGGYLDKLDAQSRFLEIPPGGTTFVVTAPAGGSASAVITYRAGWVL